MAGFESPNYTQTPNDFFKMIPSMSEAELRVTLVMIRQTFGFHRNEFKMGVTKLANLAGLSRQGALDGAKAAETRGTFKRSNPNDQTEAEWELVVDLQPVDTPLQPVEGYPLASGGQVGIKERLKKDSKEARKILKKSDPAWAILAGEDVTQEDQEEKKLEQGAFSAFERDLNVADNWSWYAARGSEDKAYKILREHVVRVYKENPKCFQAYQTWRTQPYARGAMSNLAIKKNPENFPASWTDFLASSAMYGKRDEGRGVKLDDHGAPITY